MGKRDWMIFKAKSSVQWKGAGKLTIRDFEKIGYEAPLVILSFKANGQ